MDYRCAKHFLLLSVASFSSLCEPLLPLNHACQHVSYGCASCQYVPAPMSLRRICLHMLCFANKVTWCLREEGPALCCRKLLFFRVTQSKRKDHIVCWTCKRCHKHTLYRAIQCVLPYTCWQGLASRWVLTYLKLKSVAFPSGGGSERSAQAEQIKLN